MPKRFRIDFTVRELDVPLEDARGITFGDDVPVEQITDFFNKCRDVARTLFVPGPAPNVNVDINVKIPPAGQTNLQRSITSLEREIEKRAHERSISSAGLRPFPGDDGSRGGDGPCSDEAIAWYKAQMDPNRDRY